MRITLVDVQTRKTAINKDLSGGFGTSSDFGNGLAGTLLKKMKKHGVRLPVLAFGYLAAILRQQGHDVRFSTGASVPGTDLYLIYASLVEHAAEIDCARRLKQEEGARIGFMGSLATARPELFRAVADLVITGEPEGLLADGGIITQSGVIRIEPLPDLDRLPFPDWDPFPYHQFSYAHYLPARPFFPILSSRGCPYSCGYYCPYPAFQGRQLRLRSVTNVVDEIEQLINKYQARSLLFRDPIFTLDKRRAGGIAEEIINRRLVIRWVCETHLSRLDPELIDIMFEAGLRGLNVGVESIDPEVLKGVKRKAYSLEHQETIIRYAEEKGIRVGAFYIFGNPGDTERSIQATIDYALGLNTSFAQFTISTPYPGTQFFEDLKDRLLTNRWEDFDIYTPTFAHPNFTPADLTELKQKAYSLYYFRWKWLRRYLRTTLRQKKTGDISPLR